MAMGSPLLGCLVGLLALPLAAQEASLPAAAQREKDRRGEARGRAGEKRVYTNEDLEAARQTGSRRGNLNLMEPGTSEPAGASATSASGSEGGEAEGGATAQESESDWRQRALDSRTNIEAADRAYAEAKANVEELRQRLSPMSASYIQDPNERLRLQAELVALEQAQAQAQNDLEAFREEYRAMLREAQRKRVPASWVSVGS
jgi:hypothetical protein